MMSQAPTGRLRYATIIVVLLTATCFLLGRLLYVYLGDNARFPINTVKIVASYKHLTHAQLEKILEKYAEKSFFTLPVHELYQALFELPWTGQVEIERIWPDILNITIKEKKPIATWNHALLSENGEVFKDAEVGSDNLKLPHLIGPAQATKEVLQMYKKMSGILTKYGLSIDSLQQRNNHAWEASLTNGVTLKLGKEDVLERVARFSKAFPLLSEHPQPIVSVDCRYPKGMAVKWQAKF